jgi:hypothetical protein
VGNGAGRAINLEDELYLSRLPHSLVLAAAGRAARGITRRLMPVLDGRPQGGNGVPRSMKMGNIPSR